MLLHVQWALLRGFTDPNSAFRLLRIPIRIAHCSWGNPGASETTLYQPATARVPEVVRKSVVAVNPSCALRNALCEGRQHPLAPPAGGADQEIRVLSIGLASLRKVRLMNTSGGGV